MPPMQSIPRPNDSVSVAEAVEAIKPSFDDLVELANVNLDAATGPILPEAFDGLARRAQSVGWDFDTAADAIRELAHRRLGAEGAAFD